MYTDAISVPRDSIFLYEHIKLVNPLRRGHTTMVYFTLYIFKFRHFLTREFIWQKSIFHKALKYGIIAFCYLLFEKEPVFPF